jgi:serine/threonine protein kinase
MEATMSKRSTASFSMIRPGRQIQAEAPGTRFHISNTRFEDLSTLGEPVRADERMGGPVHGTDDSTTGRNVFSNHAPCPQVPRQTFESCIKKFLSSDFFNIQRISPASTFHQYLLRPKFPFDQPCPQIPKPISVPNSYISLSKYSPVCRSSSPMRRFEEIKVIDEGAFGVVSKCRDRETGEIVAVKKMKQRTATFDECLQMKEVKSLRKFRHDNVMRLLQVFRENDHLFLVLELLPDGSLLHTMRNHSGPFAESEIRFIAAQILEGLAYVHRQGFFHRDLKPENLLWSGDRLKLADFGLAREIRSRPPYTEYVSTRWYRAPEIVLRHDFYNSPVDIWAAGCIIAELFTQKPLFQGTSETDQFFKICGIVGPPGPTNWPDGVRLATRLGIRLPQTASVPLASAIPGASSEAIDLLRQMLQLDPTRRPGASQALQHPWFTGVVTPLSGDTPQLNEIVPESAPPPEVPRRPVVPFVSSGDTPEFDDIFDGID